MQQQHLFKIPFKDAEYNFYKKNVFFFVFFYIFIQTVSYEIKNNLALSSAAIAVCRNASLLVKNIQSDPGGGSLRC